MLPNAKTMTLNVEYTVSPVTVATASGADIIIIGYMDYTVVVSNPKIAGELYFISLS